VRPSNTLIVTADLNDIDPQAWPADVLTRLPDHRIIPKRNHEPLTGVSKRDDRTKIAPKEGVLGAVRH
jgi:hypothetical protein